MVNPKDMDTTTKALAVVTLKMSGASFVDIARELEYESPQTAKAAYERILAESVDENVDLPRARALQNARMSRLLQSLWRKALDDKHPDHLAYNRQALDTIRAMNKMNAIDLPTQVEVKVTPSMAAIEAWAADFARQVTGDEITVEADIFEMPLLEARHDD